MTEVYLHVGPVKTGSIYLQDLMWAHRADMARQGLLLPVRHDNEMWFAANDVQDCAFGGRLHVVVMARSLAAMLPSLWQEKVKMADPDMSWPDFLRAEREMGSPWTDASAIVGRWLRHVPAARIHVVTVPHRGAARRILLDRFASVVAIDISTWHDDARRNESLDAVQAELVRRLNQVTAGSLDRRAPPCQRGRALVVGGAEPSRRLRVPMSEREWIHAETSRRSDQLRRSGATLHGSLDELASPADSWENETTVMLLLAASHPDDGADGRAFV